RSLSCSSSTTCKSWPALRTACSPSTTALSLRTEHRRSRSPIRRCRHSSAEPMSACRGARPMLRVVDLGVSIGRIQIVRNAAIDLREGEMCGLIGRNGAGKTTFLRALMGAVPATGKAELGRIDLLTLPAHRRVGLGIGYMPEDRGLVPEFTVKQNIRLPTWTTAVDDVEQRLTWIFSIMPEVAGFRSRRAVELSGGQQKMVALARALMAGRRMLLLDEPFEGLAPALAL